jgi:hypothetical protein
MSALTVEWGPVTLQNVAPFPGWMGPGGPGIFVVMTRPKPDTAPNEFKAVYFGEAANLEQAEFFRSHPKFRCCVSEAETADKLYFAIFLMPETTEEQRKNVARALANEFHPICNW